MIKDCNVLQSFFVYEKIYKIMKFITIEISQYYNFVNTIDILWIWNKIVIWQYYRGVL